MKPGRRLDAALDGHLFKMPVRWGPEPYVTTFPIPKGPRPEQPYRKGQGPDGCEYDWAEVPRYSSNLSAAWAVVEAMRAAGWHHFHLFTYSCIEAQFVRDEGRAVSVARDLASPAAAIAVAAAQALGLEIGDEP